MTIIPTISSGTAGPLCAKHLPRLWPKASLDAAGKLHPDYPAAGPGFDQMTLDALGIAREAFLDYIRQARPSYVECEAWVRGNGSFDDAKIAAHNAAVDGYHHGAETRAEILGSVGLHDEGTILDAVSLNNLDDWNCFYKQELAS